MLYFFRRNHCSYCQGKLVFSKQLCVKCWFVGAQPVDPFLLAVLEEKGEILQGEMPERFPGSRDFVRRVEQGYAMLTPFCLGCVERCSRGGRIAPASAPNPDDETASAAAAAAAPPAAATGPLGNMFKLIKPPKWFKRWRKRRLERLAANRINPNLLPFPKHVIYGAVGHPDVPEMDPESAAKRKQVMIESLGFDPEAFADDDEEGEGAGAEGGEGDGEGESKSGSPIGAVVRSKIDSRLAKEAASKARQWLCRSRSPVL